MGFQDVAQLRESWESHFHRGQFFLPTPKPFAAGTEFVLVFSIPTRKIGALVKAQVLRSPPNRSNSSSGMEVEIYYFDKIAPRLNALIQDLDLSRWQDFHDFTSPPQDPIPESVRKLMKMFKTLDHYEMLGVDHAATSKEIQDRYFALVKDLHPDRYARLISEEESAALALTYQKVNEAYEVLKNKEKRSRYDMAKNILVRARDERKEDFERKKMQKVVHNVRRDNLDKVSKAERIFGEALQAEKEGQLTAAIQSIRIVCMLDPLNPKYKAKLKALEKAAPAQKPAKPVDQKKMEALLRREESAAKGKKA